MITNFRGPHYFLSNFAVTPFMWDGKPYQTVEHFFQAMKMTCEEDHEAVRNSSTPQVAKSTGRSKPCRFDWEEVKDSIMLQGLRAKFASNPRLASGLVNTGSVELIEGNTWGDRVWGAVWDGSQWVGENRLGKALMKVRQELQNQRGTEELSALSTVVDSKQSI